MKRPDNYVYLKKDTHQYFDLDGREYLSVSKFIGKFQKQFDSKLIAPRVAASKGISTQEVLDDWEGTKNDGINWGNTIHDALELYANTTQILTENEHLRPVITSIYREFDGYYRISPEKILYNEEYLIAGTTDLRLQRTSSSKSIIDFEDYKTYLSRGVEYNSRQNNFYLEPLEHLQDCNWMKACLQLSTYAWMEQKLRGGKIGQLAIRYIPPDDPLNHHRIYIPYMKHEVESMLKVHGLR